MRSPVVRLVLFLIIVVLIIGWVSAGHDDYSAAARTFLRQLFRRMF
jgi:hypothetical protein